MEAGTVDVEDAQILANPPALIIAEHQLPIHQLHVKVLHASLLVKAPARLLVCILANMVQNNRFYV